MTTIMPAPHSATAGEPRLIIPPLAGFYSHARDLSWLVVRLTAGGMLLVHGIMKVMPMAEKGFTATIEAFAAGSMARRGIEPALAAAYVVFFLETIGAVMIILGLFTRFIAAALAVEFAIITFVAHWPQGFTWSRGGWEYPLFWGGSSCSRSPCAAAARIRSTASSAGSCNPARANPAGTSGHSSDRWRPKRPGYSAAARTFWACAACFERRHKPPTVTTRTAPTKAAASSM
jgi:putative oxidoreductase